MIAAWMLYAIVIGAFLGGSGLALERVLRTHGRPTRGVWLGVMLLSVGLPLGQWSWANRPRQGPELAPPPVAPEAVAEPLPEVLPQQTLTVEVPPDSILRILDGPILVAWGLASGMLLLFFGFVFLRTHLLQRRWHEDEAGGEAVLFSREWGPAVVGFLRPKIVLPWWCRDLDERALRFILDHELEHVRAGDLRLILLAGTIPVLFPWHLPLWWQLASLRIAVEGDCDLRVLRKNPGQTRPYVGLLLDVGERISGRPLLAAMLSEPYATLKRRIKVMTMPFPKRPWVRGGVFVGVGAVLMALACWAPGPVDAPGSEEDLQAGTVAGEVAAADHRTPPTFTPYTVYPDIKNLDEVTAALRDVYPASLKEAGLGGTARIWMFLDEEAKVVNVQLNQSSGHPELDEAAIRLAGLFQWTPALNRDRKTPVWVSLPIAFTPGEGEVMENEQPRVVAGRASFPRAGEAEEHEQWIGLPRGVVSGTVRDSQSGQPLRWVQVWISATSQGTLTNEEGRFVIQDVPTGSRGVMVQLIGYVPAADEVEVRAGEEAVLDLGLRATALGYSPLVVRGGSGL